MLCARGYPSCAPLCIWTDHHTQHPSAWVWSNALFGVIEHTRSAASRDLFRSHFPFPLHFPPALCLLFFPNLLTRTHFNTCTTVHSNPTPPHATPRPSPHFLTPPFPFSLLLLFLSNLFLPLHTWTASMFVFIGFVGAWVTFEGCFAPFGFGGAHQVFDKKPKPLSLMPKVRAFSPGSSKTQAIVAWPTFQTRKLILDTSLAIQDDFTDFNATRWVVQEFKRCWLKRLFTQITSTTHARLVRTFYEHLTYDCNRPNILSSTIDDIDIEVTTLDIAAVVQIST